ncbi:hypothetical protein C7Y72_05150 [Paraconexibacter algicola]|uniref:Uncharacterized protein n=1 Tax=Paraconexibacter algicola TaxID=2133960 RepID=A0A2T4UIN7_9ACTN|nr:hypothetical protein C7Y72_05150 [Paraconexibacter algicola]
MTAAPCRPIAANVPPAPPAATAPAPAIPAPATAAPPPPTPPAPAPPAPAPKTPASAELFSAAPGTTGSSTAIAARWRWTSSLNAVQPAHASR